MHDCDELEEYKAYLKRDEGLDRGFLWEDHQPFRPYFCDLQAKCTEIPFPTSASDFAHLATYLPTLREMDRAQWAGGTLVFTDWGMGSQEASLAGYQMVERIRSTFGELRPFDVATVNQFREDERHLLAKLHSCDTGLRLGCLLYSKLRRMLRLHQPR